MLKRTSLAPISGNKTNRKKLDLLTKGKIAEQAQLEATLTQVSRSLSVPRSTIYSVLKKLQTTPFEVNKLRSGRPSVITPRAERKLLRQVRLKPKITWVHLKRNTRLHFDSRTLQRVLNAHGISHWLALERPKLTPEVAQLRLRWTLKHKDWTVNQWRKVIWSDEAFVAQESSKAREWVFETPQQKWDRYKITTVPNEKPFRIIVWGAFWGSERSDLHLLKRDWESKKMVIQQPLISRFWISIWLKYEIQVYCLCRITLRFMQSKKRSSGFRKRV